MDKYMKALVAVIVLMTVGGVVYGQKLRDENVELKQQVEELKNPEMMAKKEISELTAKLSKLVVLPEGEEPVVATVTDKDKLKDQPVFAKAENGDKILIYSVAKKAYIYRPSSNMIIDVVPVNIGDGQIGLSGVDVNHPLRVALVNGTKTANLTGELEKRMLERKIGGVRVVSKATGKSTDYEKTLVIDLTGKYSKQAGELANLVGGEVATTSSEVKPDADLMVIIGANFK